MLTPLTPLSVSSVLCCASISFPYAVRLSRLSRLCFAVRLSRSSISFVYLLRLSRLSRSSISCVCLVYLVCVMLCVCLVRLSSVRVLLTPLNSFKHVKRVNSFKRPCASVLLVLFILPPKQFDPFDPFQIFRAFDSYNYLSNSSVSIGSKCLPPRALRRFKINFFKLMGKPERFEVFNSI